MRFNTKILIADRLKPLVALNEVKVFIGAVIIFVATSRLALCSLGR